MGNNVISTVITNYDETIALDALIDIKEDNSIEYFSTAFSFKISEDRTEIWDNGAFVFKEFKDYLNRWKNRRLTDKDVKSEVFIEIQHLLTDEWVGEVLNIINDAEKLGWHKLKK